VYLACDAELKFAVVLRDNFADLVNETEHIVPFEIMGRGMSEHGLQRASIGTGYPLTGGSTGDFRLRLIRFHNSTSV
jgi:hypothetical protein